jgi:hypothetical protein
VVSRSPASRHDATAQHFLSTAAELIDAYLRVGPTLRDRLAHIRFPSALDWLRTEDVIRLAAPGNEGTSRRDFFSRWPTREDFLPDAVVYSLLRDYDTNDPFEYVSRIRAIPTSLGSTSALLMGIAEGLLAALVRHPCSYLILHLGPLLPQQPKLWSALLPRTHAPFRAWIAVYEQLVNGLDLVMRPEWTRDSTSLVLQAMLDGFVLRHRLDPTLPANRWEGASIFADAIIAFLLGAVDWDLTGQPARKALDTLVRP